jgi:hypothetical protein
MQLSVPLDLEMLINKRLSSGAYASVEDVLRGALEAPILRKAFYKQSAESFLRAHRLGAKFI